MFNFRNWVWVGCFLASVITPVHAAKFPTEHISISGTVNVNKDPTDNGVVPFGRYIFTGSPQYNGPQDSDFPPHSVDYVAMRVNFTNWSKDIDNYRTVSIGHGFYLAFGIRDDRGDIWATNTVLVNSFPVKSPGDMVVSVLTDATGTDFVGDFSYSNSKVAFIFEADSDVCKKSSEIKINNSGVCAIVNINLNFHVANSTCQIITAHNMAFVWTSLSPSEISNGSAESKTAPVTMQCSNAGGIEPVAVTFTSSGGTYDAAQGIVKTNLANLGLQLTWASNGQPVVMDKEITFPALSTSTEDLSVNAKPVQLGSTSVGGGSFSTQVTMNVEYR